VAVPIAPIPEQHEIEVGERVWFDRTQTQRVLELVGKPISPGTFWGFNYEDHRAWIRSESTVNKEVLADETPTQQRLNADAATR
jgi:hypothetical protein